MPSTRAPVLSQRNPSRVCRSFYTNRKAVTGLLKRATLLSKRKFVPFHAVLRNFIEREKIPSSKVRIRWKKDKIKNDHKDMEKQRVIKTICTVHL